MSPSPSSKMDMETLASLNCQLICICWLGPMGEITGFTPAFAHLIGNPDSAAPIEFASLVHPEDRPAFMAEIGQVLNGKMLNRQLVRLVIPDGRVILMEAQAEPWGSGGAVVNLWERPSEESRPWSADTELEAFQDEVKSFIHNLFDPVVLINTDGRIVHVNRPVLELTGYRNFELVGNPIAMLFENKREDIQGAMLRFAKMMRVGQLRDVESRWFNREGEKIPVTISGSIIRSSGGGLCGMVLVARDERKNALLQSVAKKNRELEAAYAELQRLDKMKDDVLSLVGHELRAPLSNILGYAEFLHEWELSEEEKRNFVRIIHQESQHLRRLVNDILDLTRMEAGRMIYLRVRDSINRVTLAAVEVLRADAEKKGVTLTLDLDEQLEPQEFDPDRIQQVVSNIVNNAIKFTPAGKTVVIQTAAVEGGIRVSVTDEGIGIAAEDQDRVFSRFEQIVEVSHHHEGAGLGMAIAKSIVEEGHGGRIWFESAGKGAGATFHVIIPEKSPEP